MRLLDLVAHSTQPMILAPHAGARQWIEVSGPSDYAGQVSQCPLRFVIGDDLTRASAQLAFADGDRLAGCLDLLRIPASSLWVEWSDEVHQQAIYQCGSIAQREPAAPGRQVGVWLQASPGGRAAIARTFWNEVGPHALPGAVQMSPLETHIDLDGTFSSHADLDDIFRGSFIHVTNGADPGVAAILERVRFRFDAPWSAYYRVAAPDADARREVLRGSVAAVARDIPMLLAFFLLLNAKGATRPIPVDRTFLNRKRVGRGRAPLLDHIEVRASLPEHDGVTGFSELPGSRRPPRLHHVRGHLVRREDRIFWRTPHLRGSASQGIVRSRTVCLSFARALGPLTA
jgi:hypothetical protein